MPTRSVKLKLIIPRGTDPEAVGLRRALWATHAAVNEAVAHYEGLLLEMRQDDVCVGIADDGSYRIVAKDVWHARLRNRLVERGIAREHVDVACRALRALYERIVRSSVKPGSGSAQDGRGFHSRLVDPDSKGGDSAREKRLMWSALIDKADEPLDSWAMEARQIMSKIGDTLKKATGAPARYVRLYVDDADGTAWLAALQQQLQRWKKDSDDPLSWLVEHGVMPLTEPFFAGRIADDGKRGGRGALTTHERMAFALAIGHINAWESWNHRAREQHAARQERVADWEQKYASSHSDALEMVREFEAKRGSELSRVAFWSESSCYRLKARELRGWPELRDWLLEHPEATAAQRREHVRDMQRSMGRRFGSETVLQWVANPIRRPLVEHSEGDVISKIAAYNGYTELLERTKRHPVCTFADARLHPRYAQFDPPANSNQPPFEFAIDDAGHMTLELELLSPNGSDMGRLERQRFSVPLAPSGQVELASLLPNANGKKKLKLRRRSQDKLGWIESEMGGSSLMFDRRAVSARSPDALNDGSIGSVWLRLSLDIEGASPSELQRRMDARRWLSSAAQNRRKCPPPDAGFRVMSVHLGVHCSAACSVFSIEDVDEADCMPKVRHERSFVLRLPGERPDADEVARRKQADSDVWAVRYGITRLRALRRLCLADVKQDRIEQLEGVAKTRRGDVSVPAISEEEIAVLLRIVDASDEEWRSTGTGIYERVEQDFGDHIDQWRKRQTEPATTGRLGGKSFWMLEYLEATRRALMQWERHHHPMHTDVRRANKVERGVFAANLLSHINGLKDDRIKTTSDLIVQAARGLVRGNAQWHRRHEPVDLIVMEDLSHFRFRNERPRAENSLLMRWAHREVSNSVRLQAEEVGILVADTGAPFSGSYDACTNAPGMRCRTLTRDDVRALREDEPHWLKRVLERELGEFRIDPKKLAPEDLVPTGSGSEIVTLAGDTSVRVRNAEINAAQAIALRYLQAHRPTSRVVGAKTKGGDGNELFVNSSLGDRAAGAIGGKVAVLQPAESDGDELYTLSTYSDSAAAAKAIGLSRAAIGRTGTDDTAVGSDSDSLIDAEAESDAAALLDATLSERRVFFRDASGAHHDDRWAPSKTFWSGVRREIVRRLRSNGRLHG